MINANELRIGNYFIRELHSGRGLTYDHDYMINEEAMGAIFNQDKNLALQDLFPIPLTPEILEACGFEKMKKRYYRDEDGYVNDKYFLSGSWFHRFTSDGGAIVLNDSVHSLHQLQNLYFSLTGQELTYPPSQDNNINNDKK